MLRVIRLLAAEMESGRRVYEEVVVEDVAAGVVRIKQSPGLVLGIAAGDVVSVRSDGTFSVQTRAGNVAVHIFNDRDIAKVAETAKGLFGGIGGWMDGLAKKEVVITVPARSGFDQIEDALRALVALHPETEWGYGNVYDSSDGITPLNWWNEGPGLE